MNGENNINIIEITADYLYIIILGDKSSIDELIYDMQSNDKIEDVQYISVKIDNPSANKCDELIKNIILDDNNIKSFKNIILDDGIETAQCYTYAEGYNNQLYMLMILTKNNNSNNYILGFPKFNLNDDDDPEILIENWFRKKIKRIPTGLKKNFKLITIVGKNTNILVIATKIYKKK
jgi:hypothetical protein